MKIAFLGDIAARGYEDTLNREAAREILAPILPELLRADLRVPNWENPTTIRLSPIEKSGPALHSKPQNIGFLQEAWVQLAVLANNHAADQGERWKPYGILRRQGSNRSGRGKISKARADRPYWKRTVSGRRSSRSGSTSSGVQRRRRLAPHPTIISA